MSQRQVTTIILTYNEQQHIRRCIDSVMPFCERVVVVDCQSTDSTREIAESLGASVIVHPWEGNQAQQMNWALSHVPITTPWVLRLDADEYVTAKLANEITHCLAGIPPVVSGIYFRRRVLFMGRWIRFGGYYPTILLRMWRHGKGVFEPRWMDEHFKLSEGSTLLFHHDIVDDNLNSLTWWIAKHNGYASREAFQTLSAKHHLQQQEEIPSRLLGSQEERKRWLKARYGRLPLFLRPVLYFLYRYFLRLGFLDGKEGLVWHLLQGLWYRFLVDAKVYQVEKWARRQNVTIAEAAMELLQIKVE
jgi:glycosyltransferase involved in cell wall biosynthesis